MFKTVQKTMMVAVLGMISMSAFSAQEGQAVRDAWTKNHPTMKLGEIKATKIPGVFELNSKEKVYIDPTGRYLMLGGKIFDTLPPAVSAQAQRAQPQEDPTPKKVDVSLLNPKNAIKFVKGDGSRVLHVFSDPDCPFCKRLEGELNNVNNVTIYMYPYPLTMLHPTAKKTAISIWCNDNPTKAWKEYLQQDIKPVDKECDNPIDSNIQLANKLGIRGTPAIIGAKGDLLPGAAPANVIEDLMKQSK